MKHTNVTYTWFAEMYKLTFIPVTWLGFQQILTKNYPDGSISTFFYILSPYTSKISCVFCSKLMQFVFKLNNILLQQEELMIFSNKQKLKTKFQKRVKELLILLLIAVKGTRNSLTTKCLCCE